MGVPRNEKNLAQTHPLQILITPSLTASSWYPSNCLSYTFPYEAEKEKSFCCCRIKSVGLKKKSSDLYVLAISDPTSGPTAKLVRFCIGMNYRTLFSSGPIVLLLRISQRFQKLDYFLKNRQKKISLRWRIIFWLKFCMNLLFWLEICIDTDNYNCLYKLQVKSQIWIVK